MAQNVINFPVALKQNTNDDSTAFGKYFWVPVWPKTLNLKGLISRVAMSQSVYSADIVKGVIEKLTEGAKGGTSAPLLLSIFQYVTGLTAEFAANGFEGGEAHGLGLARLQDREIG